MPKRRIILVCTVEGCDKPCKGQNFCRNHYAMWWKYGRTEKLRKGNKRNHPYYMLWFERKQGGVLGPEWQDFWVFAKDIGEKPGKNYFLMRRGDEPYGPNNFQWIEHLRKRKDETLKEWWARKWAARMLANPGIERRRMYARKYGMTIEQYEGMVSAQDGKCAICEQPETSVDGKTGSMRILSVDHCHTTGKVRGLLCFRCNSTLGKLEESPQLFSAMWDYMHKHSKV